MQTDQSINDNEIARKLDYLRMRTPIVDQCEIKNGCDRIIEGSDKKFCSAYLYPDLRWRLCECSAATHITHLEQAGSKKRVGQQKQKKKNRR